jgi:hypothetical protein
MSAQVYYVLHLVSLLLLSGFTFQAFANTSAERRGRTMMLTGISGFVALVAGFGLLAKLGHGFELWVIVKLVCWLGLMAISGMAFRRPGKVKQLTLVASALITVAVYSVYVLRLD